MLHHRKGLLSIPHDDTSRHAIMINGNKVWDVQSINSSTPFMQHHHADTCCEVLTQNCNKSQETSPPVAYSTTHPAPWREK